MPSGARFVAPPGTLAHPVPSLRARPSTVDLRAGDHTDVRSVRVSPPMT